MKIVSEPRKNLSSFFHQIKFIVFKIVWIKKGLLNYSPILLFLTDIYHIVILIKFSYSLIPVGFRVILMSFLSFLSQKTYPKEFLRPEVILSRSYLRNCCIWWSPLIIINLSFFKNAINSEPLGVRGQSFQGFHISLLPTTGENF